VRELKALTDKLASIGQARVLRSPMSRQHGPAKGTTPTIGVTKPHHVDGLAWVSSITLTNDDIGGWKVLRTPLT
jgi:myo-inositol catabolism protein IolS